MQMVVANKYQEIKSQLASLYLDDPRPWLVGFSGGKDSTLVAALVFDTVMSIPPERRKKPVTVLCTDKRIANRRKHHARARTEETEN